jgi:hypothetical protein
MAKARMPIPSETAASVLFRSDRTCCICRERGKPNQIHHIDEDPANNDPANLALLCLHCHEDTQIRRGFGRKLDAHQVIQYRNDWYARVQKRRDTADDIAARHQAAKPQIAIRRPGRPTEPQDLRPLANYILTLPAIRRDAYKRARQLWDTGGRQNLKQGIYDVSDVMEQILITLAAWYPPGHFDGRAPRDYMNAMKASRFNWHYAHLEPNGTGTGGTSVGPEAAALVMEDLEEMIVTLVSSLSLTLDAFDFQGWKQQWNLADESETNVA